MKRGKKMETFVIVYSDGYYPDEATPIVYESMDKFINDLKAEAIKHENEGKEDPFRFMFIDFSYEDAYNIKRGDNDAPYSHTLYTIEQWVSSYGITQEAWANRAEHGYYS